jgi:two-component sensor histidine kinase
VNPAPWKVLVVDDAPEVLTVTRLALDGFTHQGRGLELLEASSAAGAQALLAAHPDVAVAIVDVVMETDHAGLDLVRWIRHDQGNRLIRLLVRTGQAGLNPASTVLADYEINDYWEKTELTFARLQTSLVTSLRGYDDLVALERRNQQLRRWADCFPDLLGARDWNTLLSLFMVHLKELFPGSPVSAFLCRNYGAQWPLIAGVGTYPPGGNDVLVHLDEGRARVLVQAWERRCFAESAVAQALYFEGAQGGHLFFLDLPAGWDDFDRNITRLVLQNFRAALENRLLIDDLERHRADLSLLLNAEKGVTRDLHHRFRSSLQVVLSFIDIETRDRSGVSGRSPLSGAERRLQVLALLHSLLQQSPRPGVDFQTFLRALAEQDRQLVARPSEPDIEYWGVPVELSVNQAVPLALATVEMIDLLRAPRYRGEGRAPVQVILTDGPRQLSVGRSGSVFPNPVGPAPLEWELLSSLAHQAGGSVVVDGEFLRLGFPLP